jgi:predicted ATPase
MPFFLGLQAEAHACSKQFDSGLRLVREALTIVEETQQYSWKAELKRIEGELLNASSDGRAEPEECFLEALSIARQQNARCWELRTVNVLFQFWKEQDRQSEALDLLYSVYDWFTEGFDTPDIRTAKILLG